MKTHSTDLLQLSSYVAESILWMTQSMSPVT